MKHYRIVTLIAVLILAALACNLPGGGPAPANEATQVWGTVQAGSAQTLAAPSATPLPDYVWGTPTATLSIYPSSTPNGAAAVIATSAAQATYQAQSIQATMAANAAWATSVAQGQAATAQAWAWSATATANAWRPPTLLPPLPPPPQPPQPPQPVGKRISFAKGSTSANIDGSLKAGYAMDYVITAGANQWMLLSAYSPKNNVYLGVLSASGNSMLNPASQRNDFQALLPTAQDYLLRVFSPVQKSNYTLQVILPARIKFKPGAISATLPGYLPGGQVNYYTIKARAGQTMTVNLYSPHDDVFLTIYGMDDGSPMVRSMMAQTSWSGVLNLTQDYMIEAVSTGGNVNYTLEVIIP